ACFHFISLSCREKVPEAGVIVKNQPPYSPDLNPMEYLLESVQNRTRKIYLVDEDLTQGDLKSYLEMQ
ncbi:hypothetical protein IWW34DRAFT_585445, partial [Fusarium oxysporum f. sp. albedinis]